MLEIFSLQMKKWRSLATVRSKAVYNGRNLITRHPLNHQYTQPSKKPFVRVPGSLWEDFDRNIY